MAAFTHIIQKEVVRGNWKKKKKEMFNLMQNCVDAACEREEGDGWSSG